jgi:hypothetical protein
MIISPGKEESLFLSAGHSQIHGLTSSPIHSSGGAASFNRWYPEFRFAPLRIQSLSFSPKVTE